MTQELSIYDETIEFHEIANIFPLIQGAEFDELVEDITKNGLLEPIVLHEDKILDGRNRYNACQQAGITPKTVVYNGNDPLGHVISLNVLRRHLASDQRAAAAIEAEALADRFRQEAKARQAQGGGDKKSQDYKSVRQKIAEAINPDHNKSDHKLAETFGTNRQYIADMRKVRDTDPDGFEAIKQGAVKLAHVKQDAERSRKLLKRIADNRETAEPKSKPPEPTSPETNRSNDLWSVTVSNELWPVARSVHGRFRDLSNEGCFEQNLDSLIEVMTDPMKRRMGELIPKFKQWLESYDENNVITNESD